MRALTRRTIEDLVYSYIRVHGLGKGELSYEDYTNWMKYHKDLVVVTDLVSAIYLKIYPGTQGYILQLEAPGAYNYADGRVFCKIPKSLFCPFADFTRLLNYKVMGNPTNCFIDYSEDTTDYIFTLRGDWANHSEIQFKPPIIIIGGVI